MNISDNLILQTVDDLLPKKVTKTVLETCNFFNFKNKELSEVGIKLTAIYFISVLIIIFFLDAKRPTELSGYGDFLAGFFSPIAFGWLVIGYLMQNQELKNNNLSLKNQIDEYKKNLQLNTEKYEREKINEKNSFLPIFSIANYINHNKEENDNFLSQVFDIKKYCKKENYLIEIEKIKHLYIDFKLILYRHECYNLKSSNFSHRASNNTKLIIEKEYEMEIFLRENELKKLAEDETVDIKFSFEKINGETHRGIITVEYFIGDLWLSIKANRYDH